MIGKTFLRLERDFDKHVNYCRDESNAQEFLFNNPKLGEFFEVRKLALRKTFSESQTFRETLNFQNLFADLRDILWNVNEISRFKTSSNDRVGRKDQWKALDWPFARFWNSSWCVCQANYNWRFFCLLTHASLKGLINKSQYLWGVMIMIIFIFLNDFPGERF